MYGIRKIIVALCVMFCGIFFAACKKETRNKTNCITTSRDTYGSSRSFTYDESGRVSSAYVNGIPYNFAYNGLTAQCYVSVPPNPPFDYYDIFLNSDSTVMAMTNTRTSGANSYNYTYNFFYTSDGCIALCEQHDLNNNSYVIDSMVYENGDLTKRYTFSGEGIDTPSLKAYNYITYTDKVNKTGYHVHSFDQYPFSMTWCIQPFYHFFGKVSKHLPKESIVFSSNGEVAYKLNYGYIVNENGYVIEQNVSYTGATSPYSSNYTFGYSCE
jgi:YD repeat-containing protein